MEVVWVDTSGLERIIDPGGGPNLKVQVRSTRDAPWNDRVPVNRESRIRDRAIRELWRHVKRKR